jgi:hypothetical protein
MIKAAIYIKINKDMKWISPCILNTADLYIYIGPGVAKWLRRCATSRKVPGSIPVHVTGDFFRSPDRSPFMSLGIFSEASHKSVCPGWTQPLENEYQDIPGDKDLPVHRAENLTILMCRLSRNPGALNSWTSQGHVTLFWGYFNFLQTHTHISSSSSGV